MFCQNVRFVLNQQSRLVLDENKNALKLFIYFQPRMDQYFNQMEKIVIEKKTSSRVRFMLQDVIDLRKVSFEFS